MQQLSTGKRINNAVDDVAGMAISTRLTSQIRGLNQAVRNANDGISLIQTAEGATEQVTNMLQRMRELAVQASNDTNNSMDRGFLNGEFQQLRAEIDRIGQNTQWNGANILDGTGGNSGNGTFAFQVGANSRQTIEIKLPNMQTGIDRPTASVTMDVSSGIATFDFATMDHHITGTATGGNYDASKAADYLGYIVEAEVLGKKVQYQITQKDIDVANGIAADPNKTAADAEVAFLNRVTEGLGLKVAAALGSNYTVHYANDATAPSGLDGKLTVELASGAVGTALTDDTTASTNVYVTDGVKGDLSVIGGSDLVITTADAAYEGLSKIDSAMQIVNEKRSMMGAVISRLQFAQDNLSNVAAKAAESRSRIEDTDYSMATTELAKRNIIQQAAQAMLAQANQAPQLVLQLLK
jgi:flagellin